jgi:hypothetical protein
MVHKTAIGYMQAEKAEALCCIGRPRHLLLKGSDTCPAKQRSPSLHRVYNVTSCRNRGRCRVHRSTAQHEGRKVRAGALRALASGLETNRYVENTGLVEPIRVFGDRGFTCRRTARAKGIEPVYRPTATDRDVERYTAVESA